MNNFSNLLILPQSSQLYEAFSFKLLQKLKSLENSISIPSKQTEKMDVEAFVRKNVVQVDSNENFPRRKIADIRFDDSKFVMNLNVISNSGFLSYLEDTSGKIYDEPKKNGSKPYFNIQFICTDDEFGAATLKLYLCSHDGEGEGFLGSSSETHKNPKKAKDLLNKISDQKSSIEVLVQAVSIGPSGGDKIFRIVGKYKN